MPSIVQRQSSIILETPTGEKATSPEFDPLDDVFYDVDFKDQIDFTTKVKTRSCKRSTDLLKEALTNSRAKAKRGESESSPIEASPRLRKENLRSGTKRLLQEDCQNLDSDNKKIKMGTLTLESMKTLLKEELKPLLEVQKEICSLSKRVSKNEDDILDLKRLTREHTKTISQLANLQGEQEVSTMALSKADRKVLEGEVENAEKCLRISGMDGVSDPMAKLKGYNIPGIDDGNSKFQKRGDKSYFILRFNTKRDRDLCMYTKDKDMRKDGLKSMRAIPAAYRQKYFEYMGMRWSYLESQRIKGNEDAKTYIDFHGLKLTLKFQEGRNKPKDVVESFMPIDQFGTEMSTLTARCTKETKRKLACSVLFPDYKGDPDALIKDLQTMLNGCKFTPFKRTKGSNHQILLEAQNNDEAEKIYKLIENAKMNNVAPRWLCDRT